ncbi:hypothetical protein KL950_005139 [Ogataea haglerorum]|nr:hypothetical protein KL950_005139 [Ogataea haglerorum]
MLESLDPDVSALVVAVESHIEAEPGASAAGDRQLVVDIAVGHGADLVREAQGGAGAPPEQLRRVGGHLAAVEVDVQPKRVRWVDQEQSGEQPQVGADVGRAAKPGLAEARVAERFAAQHVEIELVVVVDGFGARDVDDVARRELAVQREAVPEDRLDELQRRLELDEPLWAGVGEARELVFQTPVDPVERERVVRRGQVREAVARDRKQHRLLEVVARVGFDLVAGAVADAERPSLDERDGCRDGCGEAAEQFQFLHAQRARADPLLLRLEPRVVRVRHKTVRKQLQRRVHHGSLVQHVEQPHRRLRHESGQRRHLQQLRVAERVAVDVIEHQLVSLWGVDTADGGVGQFCRDKVEFRRQTERAVWVLRGGLHLGRNSVETVCEGEVFEGRLAPAVELADGEVRGREQRRQQLGEEVV